MTKLKWTWVSKYQECALMPECKYRVERDGFYYNLFRDDTGSMVTIPLHRGVIVKLEVAKNKCQHNMVYGSNK